MTKPEKYQRQIAKGLEGPFRAPSHRMSRELDSLRLIIFSDLHRGVRDGADDFQRCERAYNAALAYYFRAGYTLCLLGDVEELWECRPGPVIQKYGHSLALEERYHREGRYWRIWGNHDDLWSYPKAVQKHLGSMGLNGPVWESLRLEVRDEGTRLGELFLIHGHQGTMASDRFGRWARLPVRYLWRNWQRLTKVASTTPARDYELRKKHDEAMYRWALSKREMGVILFAGHTHRPVFRSESLVDRLSQQIDELKSRTDGQKLLELQELETELEWVRASQFQTSKVITMEAPCYFNTGCCSFGDGDVTGLEISDGRIQLVRWPDDNDQPYPEVLSRQQPTDLRQCFEEIRGSRRMPEAEEIPLKPTPPPEGAPLH